MKTFPSRLLIFCAIPIVGCISLFYLSIFIESKKIADQPIILLGDSQTEFINNPLIYNRSIHGAPYFIQYKFVKDFSRSFANKKVIIAFNNHHLSKLYQNRLYNDSLYPGWRNEMLFEYFFYDLINIWDLDFSIPENYSVDFFDFRKNKRIIMGLLNFKLAAQNTNSKILNANQIDSYVYRHWKNPSYIQPDRIQIPYLEKTLKLLKELKCKIYFLKMPLVQEYKDHVPDEAKKSFDQILLSHPEVSMINLDSTFASQLTWAHFKDYGHLNKSGDVKVNGYFSEWTRKIEISELP